MPKRCPKSVSFEMWHNSMIKFALTRSSSFRLLRLLGARKPLEICIEFILDRPTSGGLQNSMQPTKSTLLDGRPNLAGQQLYRTLHSQVESLNIFESKKLKSINNFAISRIAMTICEFQNQNCYFNSLSINRNRRTSSQLSVRRLGEQRN